MEVRTEHMHQMQQQRQQQRKVLTSSGMNSGFHSRSIPSSWKMSAAKSSQAFFV